MDLPRMIMTVQYRRTRKGLAKITRELPAAGDAELAHLLDSAARHARTMSGLQMLLGPDISKAGTCVGSLYAAKAAVYEGLANELFGLPTEETATPAGMADLLNGFYESRFSNGYGRARALRRLALALEGDLVCDILAACEEANAENAA